MKKVCYTRSRCDNYMGDSRSDRSSHSSYELPYRRDSRPRNR